MGGPRPPGRWLHAGPFPWALRWLRRRPVLYRAVYAGWAVLRSLPLLRGDPSQFGEGTLLVDSLPADGLFLDIGCNEPIRFNNTWMLRRRGWKGWSVDASDLHRPLWRILRPRDELLQLAVVGQRGVEEISFFQYQPEYSGLSTLSPSRVAEIAARGHDHRATEVVVPARHISDLLGDFARAWGRYPDLLLTDVEGLDWGLLQAAGPATLRDLGVRFILVEDLSVLGSARPDGAAAGEGVDFEAMAAAGWSVVGRAELSVLFAADPGGAC
jgi:hypothetical protein